MVADLVSIMWLPFMACLVLTLIHGYLGLHVVSREVIFVDIALAQVAALGATAAFLVGYDLESTAAYWMSLGFTLAGAAIFALTRTRERRVSQEAVIGVVYAVASAYFDIPTGATIVCVFGLALVVVWSVMVLARVMAAQESSGEATRPVPHETR
ncbi:MAG: hypothetical protein DMD82_16180 [Candidatus Rokuibacteriota bacterium]|nr:MAG: hypothetical protein DMD82_16180 [Candidatus Rokubacteria bacterium]